MTSRYSLLPNQSHRAARLETLPSTPAKRACSGRSRSAVSTSTVGAIQIRPPLIANAASEKTAQRRPRRREPPLDREFRVAIRSEYRSHPSDREDEQFAGGCLNESAQSALSGHATGMTGSSEAIRWLASRLMTCFVRNKKAYEIRFGPQTSGCLHRQIRPREPSP